MKSIHINAGRSLRLDINFQKLTQSLNRVEHVFINMTPFLFQSLVIILQNLHIQCVS
jgi:hypothetical protein